jgi:DNA primase
MIYNKDMFKSFMLNNFPDGHLTVKSTGEEYRTLCPFCKGGDSQEESFDANFDEGVVRCWRASCGYSASAAWMVKELLKVTFPKALQIVSIGNSEEDILTGFLASQDEVKMISIAPVADKIEAWEDTFEKIDHITDYPDIYNWIINRGYDPQDFHSQHKLYYPEQVGRFKGRVVFRIETDYNHAYLGYAIDKETQPKTMNPPGVKLSNMLYNYNNAASGKVIFVCEGIFDAARLVSYGLNAVAIFGSVLGNQQMNLLSKTKAGEIVMCLDNGLYNKSITFAKKLSASCRNKTISVIDIKKEGSDPDELSEEEIMDCYVNRTIVALSEEDILKSFISRGHND